MEKPDALSIAAIELQKIELQKEEYSGSTTAGYPHSPITSALPTRNSKECNFPDARFWAASGVRRSRSCGKRLPIGILSAVASGRTEFPTSEEWAAGNPAGRGTAFMKR
jgi:hypothetical protein